MFHFFHILISIHAPHEGERLLSLLLLLTSWRISIHAPHEGERHNQKPHHLQLSHISIHAPHEGERPELLKQWQVVKMAFQSTLPTRGSDCACPETVLVTPISIHAPHEGERRRKSAFVCSISANLLNIIHCGTVTRAVSRRRIALFRLFSVRRSDVFMYAYASH